MSLDAVVSSQVLRRRLTYLYPASNIWQFLSSRFPLHDFGEAAWRPTTKPRRRFDLPLTILDSTLSGKIRCANGGPPKQKRESSVARSCEVTETYIPLERNQPESGIRGADRHE